MKVKNKNKRAFTIVELLCIIVILGVLSTMAIVASYNLINKANDVHADQQENTIIMATKDYIQKDNSNAPKVVGESRNIKVSDLKENKFLKEDIKDSEGNSCMKESYVRIYKLSNTEYSYLAYIYCGNEKKPETEEVPTPTIEISYNDLKNNTIKNNKVNSIKDAKFNLKVGGGTTKGGNQIELNTYSYTISILNDTNEYIEIYDSKDINANKKSNIVITKKLKEYLEEDTTSVRINIQATNIIGGVLELTSYLQNN